MKTKKSLLLFFLLSSCIFVTATDKKQDVLRKFTNPHGSPFPPGGEPSLTHTVKVYWTTLDGMTTRINIQAEGNRATQFSYGKWEKGKQIGVGGSISPDCKYNIRFSSSKLDIEKNIRDIKIDGQGCVKVGVFGFKVEEFAKPPAVTVYYEKDGKIAGETSVIAQPLPDKFKKGK